MRYAFDMYGNSKKGVPFDVSTNPSSKKVFVIVFGPSLQEGTVLNQ